MRTGTYSAVKRQRLVLCPAMPPLEKMVDYLSENWSLSALLLIWVAAVIAGVERAFTNWKIRRMARKREAELRDD